MSKKQAIAFFEEISKNKQLAQEVEKVVEGNNSDEAKAKELTSLAQRYNFNFTPEEAAVAQGALKKPLSPEEMLEVSGGKLNLKSSLMAMALLAGLGVGGAALTNMEASAMKRRLADFSSSSDSGKRGKDENGQARKKGGTRQRTPQPVEPTNLPQNGTTASSSQGAERHAPRPPKEKKARANVEHDKKAAKRYSGVDGCGKAQVEWARRVSASGAVPAADWPAAPTANLEAEKEYCRFCGGTLSGRGEKARDVKCANAGCIYNWVFPPTGDKHLKGNQRGQLDYGHYARWALLPALILDSRLPTVGRGHYQRPRPAAIMTPAEAWAVWQLIVGHNDGWVDVTNMMVNYGVDDDVIREVLGLLEDSYDNLVLGNEHFPANLGSEIQELVKGHNNDWRDIQATMAQRGYDATAVDTAIERMEHAYNMLTNEQLAAVGIDPAAVARNPKAALDASESAHQQFEKSMQRLEAEQQQLAEEARQQAIEKLQHWEALSDDEKKAPGRLAAQSGLVKCRCQKAPGGKGCGSNNISFKSHQCGKFYFQCNECKARNDGSENGIFFKLKPDDLLDMLQEAVPENVPVEMADAEQNEQQMGTQDMSQFNPGQQMMMLRNTTHNDYGMDFDDDDDCYDREGNPRRLREEKSPEEKEQPENNEERVYESGMMGDQDPSTPMMNQTGFNFDIQWMNQINSMHPIQMNGQNFFTSDLNQRMNEVIDIDAFDNDEENMNDAPSSEKQTRPNAERRFEMEIEDEYPDEIKEQHKDYENQETNQNIPQLPHLQSHRSMILENTNETFTPFATANLDDIGDALKNEISNTAPDFARIQSMLQSATKVGANISQLLSFDDVLTLVRDAAKYHGRDDIISLIDSWRYSQGK